jgi:hypothetical protein
MRIPLKKLHRAFSELDRFSEAQCDLLMRRVHLDRRARLLVWVSPAVAFVLSVVIIVVLLATTDVLARTEQLFRDADLLLSLLCVLGISAAVGLLIRDHLLRRFLVKAIRLRIDRVRCRNCRYILIGQRPIGDGVNCPECGRMNRLRELGLSVDDLIPPESDLDRLSSEVVADQHGA